jgi:hypothetical protein
MSTDPKPSFDPVQKPEHYASGAIECIDAIKAALGVEGAIAFCRGNAIKYAWRADKKRNCGEDLRKAAWYLQMAAHLLGDGPDPRSARSGDDAPVQRRREP